MVVFEAILYVLLAASVLTVAVAAVVCLFYCIFVLPFEWLLLNDNSDDNDDDNDDDDE